MAQIIFNDNVVAPSTPAANHVTLYSKTDGNLYSKDPSGTERLVTAGSAVTALSGDVTGTVLGTTATTITAHSVTNAKLAQAPEYTILGNGVGSTADVTYLTSLTLGAPEYTDSGIITQLTSNNPAYLQEVLQNTNSGPGASADYIVSNDLGTAVSYYGDFGMNSSTFIGTGSLGLANAVYLYAQSGDLSIGTGSAHAVHFLANSSATDALTITAANTLVFPGLTGFVYANGAGVVTSSATIPNTGLANMANNTVKGNKSGVSAPPSDVALGSLSETTSSVLTITGADTLVGNTTIQVKQSGSGQDGFVSSTDWSTFNSKQPAGNYITALTSDVSASGPGSAVATVNSVGGSSAANIHTAELLINTPHSGNVVLASPSNGSSGAPTFRSFVSADLPSAVTAGVFGITVDGSGTPISTGLKGFVQIPYSCTITGWTIMADQVGSAVIALWKAPFASFPPTVTNLITDATPPTLSAAQGSTSTAVGSWTVAVTAGDVVAFNVVSASVVTRVTLEVKVSK